jgi:hypothetical protein
MRAQMKRERERSASQFCSDLANAVNSHSFADVLFQVSENELLTVPSVAADSAYPPTTTTRDSALSSSDGMCVCESVKCADVCVCVCGVCTCTCVVYVRARVYVRVRTYAHAYARVSVSVMMMMMMMTF